MDTIVSFQINHLKLKSGLYVSRKDVMGDTVTTTFDLRTVTPYVDEFMDIKAMHTLEHLGAVFFRNGKYGDNIIYFGPMGCQTGFYLVMFGDLKFEDVYDLVIDMCDYVLDFEGEVIGATKIECGNYLSHDLSGAKKIAQKYKSELQKYKRFEYC